VHLFFPLVIPALCFLPCFHLHLRLALLKLVPGGTALHKPLLTAQGFLQRERRLLFRAALMPLLGLSFGSSVEAVDSPKPVEEKSVTGAGSLGGRAEGEERQVLWQDNAASWIPLEQEPDILQCHICCCASH